MKYVFGPVNSRRFGISLGIDLSPDKKSCNFDCVYCELKGAKPVNTITNPPKVQDIIDEVKNNIIKFPNIDVITITSNGEPTLYNDLELLVDELNKIKQNKKLLILSNGSTICDKNIEKALKKIDIVKLSLDCATQKCFKKIDRPLKGIILEDIIQCIKTFSKNFKNILVIEILLVKGINDNIEEIQKLNNILMQINPQRVDIGTIDRPPAYQVKPVKDQEIEELIKYFDKKLPISLIRKKNSNKQECFNEEDILYLVSHRPQSQFDIDTFFDNNSKKIIEKMVKKGIIKKINIGGTVFYRKIL